MLSSFKDYFYRVLTVSVITWCNDHVNLKLNIMNESSLSTVENVPHCINRVCADSGNNTQSEVLHTWRWKTPVGTPLGWLSAPRKQPSS